MAKILVGRESNYELHIDDGPYGIEEVWVPKDIWWEEDEMQEDTQLDFDAALEELKRTMPRNADGDYTRGE